MRTKTGKFAKFLRVESAGKRHELREVWQFECTKCTSLYETHREYSPNSVHESYTKVAESFETETCDACKGKHND